VIMRILGPLVGNIDSFIKDSSDFVRMIKNEKVDPNDILLINFDVVSLFTKIPLNEEVQIVKEVIDPKTTKLVEVCL
jgi:hypothetical protein